MYSFFKGNVILVIFLLNTHLVHLAPPTEEAANLKSGKTVVSIYSSIKDGIKVVIDISYKVVKVFPKALSWFGYGNDVSNPETLVRTSTSEVTLEYDKTVVKNEEEVSADEMVPDCDIPPYPDDNVTPSPDNEPKPETKSFDKPETMTQSEIEEHIIQDLVDYQNEIEKISEKYVNSEQKENIDSSQTVVEKILANQPEILPTIVEANDKPDKKLNALDKEDISVKPKDTPLEIKSMPIQIQQVPSTESQSILNPIGSKNTNDAENDSSNKENVDNGTPSNENVKENDQEEIIKDDNRTETNPFKEDLKNLVEVKIVDTKGETENGQAHVENTSQKAIDIDEKTSTDKKPTNDGEKLKENDKEDTISEGKTDLKVSRPDNPTTDSRDGNIEQNKMIDKEQPILPKDETSGDKEKVSKSQNDSAVPTDPKNLHPEKLDSLKESDLNDRSGKIEETKIVSTVETSTAAEPNAEDTNKYSGNQDTPTKNNEPENPTIDSQDGKIEHDKIIGKEQPISKDETLADKEKVTKSQKEPIVSTDPSNLHPEKLDSTKDTDVNDRSEEKIVDVVEKPSTAEPIAENFITNDTGNKDNPTINNKQGDEEKSENKFQKDPVTEGKPDEEIGLTEESDGSKEEEHYLPEYISKEPIPSLRNVLKNDKNSKTKKKKKDKNKMSSDDKSDSLEKQLIADLKNLNIDENTIKDYMKSFKNDIKKIYKEGRSDRNKLNDFIHKIGSIMDDKAKKKDKKRRSVIREEDL